MKKITLSFIIALFVFSLVNIRLDNSYASDYIKIQSLKDGSTNTIVQGEYTFIYDFSDGIYKTIDIYKGNNKKAVFRLKNVNDILFGAQKLYYSKNINDKALEIQEFDLKTKKTKNILKIKINDYEEPYQNIVLQNIIGENLYFQRSKYTIEEPKLPLYKLNLKTKKYSEILQSYGDVSFITDRFFYIEKTENMPVSSILMSCDYEGKNKKVIAKNIDDFKALDKKIYYTQIVLKDDKKQEEIIYLADENGENKKALTKKMDNIILEKISKDEIIFSSGKANQKYKLEISNGKLTQLKDKSNK